MKIYTIGFTKKTAQEFFETLHNNNINELIDIRLNNKSQLAGFAKGRDLQYFLNELCGIRYYHEETFAPTKELLGDWKNGKITWSTYEEIYNKLMERRHAVDIFKKKYVDASEKNICLLCSESTPEHCHRRLLADYLAEQCEQLVKRDIVHL